ncbi:ubiquitin carboxyl-terminal hydrolase [Acrasis kona]|uniref:Ubiquitin carboxyl-terminal hydrolase n=1 Tax=Acrasis kona TaxID=1008807 RepID=A0AAW2Z4G5_9EUKA
MNFFRTEKSKTAVLSSIPLKGMYNPNGAQNCFLNVVIQMLWSFDLFRNIFMSIDYKDHKHQDPSVCVFCSLKKLFTHYYQTDQTTILPAEIRQVLSNAYQNTNQFQMNQMSDASELFNAVLDNINNSLTSVRIPTFDFNIGEDTNCTKCHRTTETFIYQSNIWYISASEFIVFHKRNKKLSFEQVFRVVSEHERKSCDHCKTINPVRKNILNLPSILSLGMAWEKSTVSTSEITSFVKFLKYKDVKVMTMFSNVNMDLRADLVGMICYYGKHYVCLILEKNLGWVIIDDNVIKIVHDMNDLIVQWKLQPSILFYKINNLDKPVQLIPKLNVPSTPDIAMMKRESLRQSIRIDSPILRRIVENEPEDLSTTKSSSQSSSAPPGTDGSNFGIILQGGSPITRMSKRVDNEQRVTYYSSIVWTDQEAPQELSIQEMCIKMCVYAKDGGSLRRDDVFLISVKFYDDKCIEFAELDQGRMSAFLEIPYFLHKYKSFEVRFTKKM